MICNNDDMALGAIDAIKRADIRAKGAIKVVGIDGTPVGKEALAAGESVRHGGVGPGAVRQGDL